MGDTVLRLESPPDAAEMPTDTGAAPGAVEGPGRGTRSSSADIDPTARVASTASVWHLAQVREHADLGEHVIVGRGAYVGSGVVVGANSKIQNYALVYEPAVLADGVFVGPAAVLTNDRLPRAVTPDGRQKAATDWQLVGVTVGQGASIGARAVCVAPVRIGAWAMVAAGAVVTADVPAHALVVGVPARRVGWVSRSGERLTVDPADPHTWVCPTTGDRFAEHDGSLREVAA